MGTSLPRVLSENCAPLTIGKLVARNRTASARRINGCRGAVSHWRNAQRNPQFSWPLPRRHSQAHRPDTTRVLLPPRVWNAWRYVLTAWSSICVEA